MKSYQNLCLGLGLVMGLELALLSVPAQAITIEDVPNPRGYGNSANSWISDTANLISPDSEAKLNQMLSALEAENGTEMAIVTVEQTASAASPRAFTTELFNAWGVGKADANNGVVFLISRGDRRAEVVVGYGLESVLTQAKIEKLLQRQAVPDFKQGDYDQGILNASKAIVSELSDSTISSTFGSRNLAKILVALSSGGLALVGVWFRRPLKKCSRCQNPLQKMSTSQLSVHLSDAQKVAIDINSAHYSGWQCSNCNFSTIQRHKHWFKGYTECYRCQEPTLMFSNREVLTPATRYHSGQAQVTRVCQCCNHTDTKLITLAPLSDNSSSSGGSSGGGGGFGGGSSGGGGGGSSW